MKISKQNMPRRLPIINLEIKGVDKRYYVDERLREYRSMDGTAPWIVKELEVDGVNISRPEYTLDGEVIDIVEFVNVNSLTPEQWNEIMDLRPNDELVFGGGAAATFILKRKGKS